jgi:hypothetical protein
LRELKRGLWDELRWSYAPPLMVYFAAGLSGLTGVVGTFFVKDHLGLSAAFLAGLTFWAGLPWALKMPLGHLVDLLWRHKSLLVFLGAALIAAANLVMYGLIAATGSMRAVMSAEAWFVLATLLSPVGFVLQDVVADAMTVEAVPTAAVDGTPLPEAEIKARHTTMQTLGRVSIISGFVAVAALNIFMFQGVEALGEAAKIRIYADIYLAALVIPVFSVAGVVAGEAIRWKRRRAMVAAGVDAETINRELHQAPEETKPNWYIFGGAAVFVAFTMLMGLADLPFNQEIIFAGSMVIVLYLMARLLRELAPAAAMALIGTAIVIFVFRAVPLPGSGLAWFEIDVLGFDQQFLAVLSLITSLLTLAGMIVLQPLIAKRSIADIVVLLSVAGGILALPNIGLYYGIQEWTEAWSGGIVDARFIAILDTMVESPLGQIAMIPMLAWIAKNAPADLKATFFAVMASFTNLALSASSLATKYVNEIFLVTREVRNRQSGVVEVPADYSQLGALLILVGVLTVALPIAAVWLVQHSRFETRE